MYQEEDYLQLSGIQHFAFCRRQWALIHVEQQWEDNLLTIEGDFIHERAHDEKIREHRGPVITERGIRVSSAELGVSGQCDVVEYHRTGHGILLPGVDGFWQPYPIEYKRGHKKANNADRLQLCLQAMCLETMLCCEIPEGAIYYDEAKRRETVILGAELRQEVKAMLLEMHQYMERGYTPRVKPSRSCSACSLKEECLPKLMKQKKVKDYMGTFMEEDG